MNGIILILSFNFFYHGEEFESLNWKKLILFETRRKLMQSAVFVYVGKMNICQVANGLKGIWFGRAPNVINIANSI